MKNIKLIALGIASLMIFGAIAQNTTAIVKSEVKTEKYKAKNGTTVLNVLQKEFKVKLGSLVSYSGATHGSVGSAFSVNPDSEGFKLEKTHFSYDDDSKANMSGGDAGTKTFVYKTLKKGTFTIEVNEYFRGGLQKTYSIKVIVE